MIARRVKWMFFIEEQMIDFLHVLLKQIRQLDTCLFNEARSQVRTWSSSCWIFSCGCIMRLSRAWIVGAIRASAASVLVCLLGCSFAHTPIVTSMPIPWAQRTDSPWIPELAACREGDRKFWSARSHQLVFAACDCCFVQLAMKLASNFGYISIDFI